MICTMQKVRGQPKCQGKLRQPLHEPLLKVVRLIVTILPRAPQKSLQNDDATKAADLKRCAHDIARDSHGIEDEIRAMVSSYMVPKDDEDLELAIGQLVC